MPDSTRLIPLSQGMVSIVDASDYQLLNQWRWSYDNKYAVRMDGKKKIYMHSFLMNTPPGMHTDHINRNKLDNRRSNLRVCTASVNIRNSENKGRYKGGLSKYRGVTYDKSKKKWLAQLSVESKNIFLGHYRLETDAASASLSARTQLGEL